MGNSESRRKRAHAIAERERNYEEFKVWFRAYIQMATPPNPWSSVPAEKSIPDLLCDRSKWRWLATYYGPQWKDPEWVLSDLRRLIYRIEP